MNERLAQQLAFLREIDALKGVQRRSLCMDASRRENSAEHSWHIALMALVLHEYAEPSVDLARVLMLLLVHDIVEIDAGDTFCYDTDGYRDKQAREQAAADRIFNLLPAEQADRIHRLWREFEEARTAEARFANAVDRLMPLLHNYYTGGRVWQEHGVDRDQVIGRNRVIRAGAPRLWDYAQALIDDAVARGLLSPGGEATNGDS